jgi:NAD(P)-dependent dehydrogenase (short-subunit alcohol dehydrogenase family)
MFRFWYYKNAFSADQVEPQDQKTFLVTGSQGIGLHTALELARKGGNVYLTARSTEKGKQAVEKIKKEVPEGNIDFIELDLGDLNQVSDAAEKFKKKVTKLDVLINNAGLMDDTFRLTKDGIESHFGVNFVGHYLLTRELMPILKEGSRIINVASDLHHLAKHLELDKVNDPKSMSQMDRYGNSKLANILFTNALDKRYRSKGITCVSVHPGLVNTEIVAKYKFESALFGYLNALAANLIGLSPHEGSLTSLYCATHPLISQHPGAFYIPIGVRSVPSQLAQSPDLAEKLWDFTERLVNEKLNK